MGATQSILLYGTEIRADTLEKDMHLKRLVHVQRRRVLRMASAYPTVSEPALMVILGMISVALHVKKRRKGEKVEVVAREEHQRTLIEWQLNRVLALKEGNASLIH